jgi:squalene-hopene/tetraprenyl-beta-curcumene cyclase
LIEWRFDAVVVSRGCGLRFVRPADAQDRLARDFTMRVTTPLLVALIPALASAQESAAPRAAVETAIHRGLDFLAADALAWKEEHQCASCHHASLVVLAMREAKDSGRAVDEPLLSELTNWMAESGDGKFTLARPASAPHAASPKAIYFALALGADPEPNPAVEEGRKRLLATVRAEQTEQGSWSAWPGTRPPIFGSSDESLTLLATLALLPAAAADDREAQSARDLSFQWLTRTRTDDDPQSIALRLVLWNRLGRPAAESQPLAQRIRERQNSDGGWSQTTAMPSDAWATGQALYALAHGGINSGDPAIVRGQDFLVRTQRGNGSWPMTSRPATPGGPGSSSLIPITGGGAAWGVLGLVRSAPAANRAATAGRTAPPD